MIKTVFDIDDANVFVHNDDLLRAEALRYAIVPRLQAILKDSCGLISEVFGSDSLSKSTFISSPNYRPNRSTKPVPMYFHASVGLGGSRVKGTWKGVERKDGSTVQILPFQYSLTLCHDGLCIHFTNMWLSGLSDKSYERYLVFLLDKWDIFEPLFYHSSVVPYTISLLDMPVKEVIQNKIKYKDYLLEFASRFIQFPISEGSITQLKSDYVSFFILYKAMIELSAGNDPDPSADIDKLLHHYESLSELPTSENLDKNNEEEENFRLIESNAKIIPSLRWRVFSMDKWKCRSCGRSVDDGVVLQVDHIIPKSKGGTNSIENLQTLCWECNIGKSNSDSTDLRKKSNVSKH